MYINDFISKKCPYPEAARVTIENFFREFGQMCPAEAQEFLFDPENSYILGKFFYHITGQDYIPAYNGKSRYQHCFCTVGASH